MCEEVIDRTRQRSHKVEGVVIKVVSKRYSNLRFRLSELVAQSVERRLRTCVVRDVTGLSPDLPTRYFQQNLVTV